MSLFRARIAAAALVALALAACSKEPEAPEVAKLSASPSGAIDAAVQSLKAGDLKALVESQVPPQHMDRLRTEWKEDLAKDPPSEEEKAEFAQMMGELTAADAETKLMEKLEPQLVKFETEMAPQMPMMIGMGKGLLLSSVQENKELTEAQKQQAVASVDALAKWLETAKFTDRALVRQALGHVIETARSLELETLDEARALSFDDAMAKGSIAFRGAKKVLDTYGFSIDQILDTVKTEVLSEQGDTAKVKVSYAMFGSPLSFETELVKVDGRWYGKQTVEELNKPKLPEPAEGEAETAEG